MQLIICLAFQLHFPVLFLRLPGMFGNDIALLFDLLQISSSGRMTYFHMK